MSTPSPQYAIGIDLGTSNSALAWCRLDAPEAPSTPLPLRQHLTADTFDTPRTLPSFIYFPPADTDTPPLAGLHARDTAPLRPDRVAHSAKSWLCHPWIDRESRLLPWQSESIPPAARISPVDASAHFLRHLRLCWDEAHPEAPLADQHIVLTVPASFDPAAQQLTLEAALRAGCPDTTLLLEEPQAAFTRWLEARRADPDSADTLPDTPYRVLVIDVGGGTTDFSLFSLHPARNHRIRRLAVSDHLLLGGDNIDRWLAHTFRARLEADGPPLTARQNGFLLAESRRLKEALLTENASIPPAIELPAGGAGLFTESRRVPLEPDALRAEILDTFYPPCAPGARPARAKAGLRVPGLPYAQDGAMTRHLADFLRDRDPVDAVLFNGGSLQASAVRNRILDTLAAWQNGHRPLELRNPEPDLAVARGAAAYGAYLHHQQTPIEGGFARSLYLEILDRKTREHSLLCILPQGALPQQTHTVPDQTFTALVDTPVRFQLYASTRRPDDTLGQILPLTDEDLQPLPAMQSLIRLPEKGPKPPNQQVKVRLEASINNSGLMKIHLHSADPAWKRDHRWELTFNLRAPAVQNAPYPEEDLQPRLQKALEAVRNVYGKKAGVDPRAARHLPKTLETLLARPRKHWNQQTCRALWPALAEGLTRRNRSPDHEAVWLTLAGFTLRPGIGADLDPYRIQQLWRLHDLGPAFPREARSLTQLFILWRRVAAGLDTPQQEHLADTWLAPLAHPGDHPPERLRLAGALERVHPDRKHIWIETVLRMLTTPDAKTAPPAAWALGRILSRIPFGGGPESILPPDTVERAFERLRDKADWTLPELRAAFLQAARLTDEPSLNLPPSAQADLIDHLESVGCTEEDLRPLREVIPPEDTDRTRLFGETLPSGLLF
ncbi:MAG: Hsp70 family protein [Verrucomicrobia bacterium]|nr:Hsp70 family protein [Verrucomicrobiota bacterium]MCH8526072.1 hsp70 family protein [Kiritimatiellia bacterium]